MKARFDMLSAAEMCAWMLLAVAGLRLVQWLALDRSFWDALGIAIVAAVLFMAAYEGRLIERRYHA